MPSQQCLHACSLVRFGKCCDFLFSSISITIARNSSGVSGGVSLCGGVVEVMFVLDYVGQTLGFCGRIVKDFEPVASRFLWFFAKDLHGRYIVLATEV